MCWVCAADKSVIAENYLAGRQSTHFQKANTSDSLGFTLTNTQSSLTLTRKYYDAFQADGVGDLKPITLNTALLVFP